MVVAMVTPLGGMRNHYTATISLHLSFINVVSNYFIYKSVNNRNEGGNEAPFSQSNTKPVLDGVVTHETRTSTRHNNNHLSNYNANDSNNQSRKISECNQGTAVLENEDIVLTNVAAPVSNFETPVSNLATPVEESHQSSFLCV